MIFTLTTYNTTCCIVTYVLNYIVVFYIHCMNSQITIYNDRPPAIISARSPASIKFKAKPIEYREGWFSNGGIVKRRGGERYGVIRFRPDKVIVSWDDGEKTTHPSLEVAKNWDLIEPVPWFIPGQTVVVLPLPDGSIAPECKYRVVSVSDDWIEVRQLMGDRIEKYPIGALPGFPFWNDVVIKERPLLPIPPRHELMLAAGKYLWGKKLVELIGKKDELYSIFRQNQSRWSETEADFVWAWEKEWNMFVKRQARDFGHGGKKIGTRLYVEGVIERLVEFDTKTFEFITDCDRRIPLLQLYLYSELAIDILAPNFYILSAGDFMEARIGFDNKLKAKKHEALIKRISGCKEPRFVAGDYTGRKHEWIVINPFKKPETFLKHLMQLAKIVTS